MAFPLLSKISNPQDLKELSSQQMPALCQEIREFLIEKVKERHHWSQEQLMDACPPEYYFNFLTWLIMESGGYVPVWEKFVYGPVNQLQHDALQQLKREKLYLGNIPDVHLHK